MDNIIILARYLGVLYFVISLAALIKRGKVRTMLRSLRSSRSIFFAMGTVVFAFGLLIIMLHGNFWSGFAGIAIGVIGWGAVAESLLYLFLPHRSLAALFAYIDDEDTLIASSIIGIGLGLALLVVGLQIL